MARGWWLATMIGVGCGAAAEPGDVAPTPTSAAPPPTTVPATAATTCPAGMVPVEGGSFQMGSDAGAGDERPVHRVDVASFCMDTTEVTVAAYGACARAGKCTDADARAPEGFRQYCNHGVPDRDEHPINCVDWEQASAYCKAGGMRLPTEEEWEYAARGGAKQLDYPWGAEPPEPGKQLCWSGEGGDSSEEARPGTCEVGSYPSGAFGLKDMAGNVWEWTATVFCPYPGAQATHCEATQRAIRGAAWGFSDPPSVRSAARGQFEPDTRDYAIGFRCVR
jgi:formylglycine-generating enzyme required for sulfatase activity